MSKLPARRFMRCRNTNSGFHDSLRRDRIPISAPSGPRPRSHRRQVWSSVTRCPIRTARPVRHATSRAPNAVTNAAGGARTPPPLVYDIVPVARASPRPRTLCRATLRASQCDRGDQRCRDAARGHSATRARTCHRAFRRRRHHTGVDPVAEREGAHGDRRAAFAPPRRPRRASSWRR